MSPGGNRQVVVGIPLVAGWFVVEKGGKI